MAAIKIQQNYEILPGVEVPFIIGTLGRGKGGTKVRVIPAAKDVNVTLSILKSLPGWEIMVTKFVANLFSTHSPACVSGLPNELTEESLKESVQNDSFVFDFAAMCESISEENTIERTGKVSASTKLAEWQAANQSRFAELVAIVLKASSSGSPVPDEVINEASQLSVEQAELTAAVEAEQAKKEERRAAREAAKSKK
jgi:hypothetical protein